MSAGKWIFRVFMVLLAMMAAWMIYSVLFEYPYSTLLSLTSSSGGQDIKEATLDAENLPKDLRAGDINSYGSRPVKAVIWQTADVMQIPFGSYYYYYTMLPSMRADEKMNAFFSRAIGVSETDYQYKNVLSDEVANASAVTREGNRTNSVTRMIPMALDMDDGDDVLMNYPTDVQSHGRFYTTGWY